MSKIEATANRLAESADRLVQVTEETQQVLRESNADLIKFMYKHEGIEKVNEQLIKHGLPEFCNGLGDVQQTGQEGGGYGKEKSPLERRAS